MFLPSNNKGEIAEDNSFSSWWEEKISRSICHCLEDSGERCREIAAEIVLLVINGIQNVKKLRLSYIFPILRHRIASCSGETSMEPSEEVRLLFLRIMITVVTKGAGSNENASILFPYFDDIIAVLKTALTDTFSDIKALSCDGIKEVSAVFNKEFHLMASTLISPILPPTKRPAVIAGLM